MRIRVPSENSIELRAILFLYSDDSSVSERWNSLSQVELVLKAIPSRLSQSPPKVAISRIVGGVIVFLAGFGWESMAQASCGDWLTHSPPPQANLVDLDSRLPVQPICRGPGCSQQPVREPSIPAAPPQLTRIDQQWVEWLEFVIPPDSAAGRASLTDAHAAAVFPPRPERPPRG